MSAEVWPAGYNWYCIECATGNGPFGYGSDAEQQADYHNKRHHPESEPAA